MRSSRIRFISPLVPVFRSVCLLLTALLIVSLAGCSSASVDADAETDSESAALEPLPDSAYYVNPDLEPWVDEGTGYDTARTWDIDGGTWPVMMIMSPSQSPQALLGFRDGLFQDAFEPLGITPELERIDGPPRTFHALERSQWPFVYMPLAVFMDYARSADNQGGAGGLQYVLIAGSTAGGGYTLMAKEPDILTVGDLAGKRVGLINYNPYPGTLMIRAAANAGFKIGTGDNEIELLNMPGDETLNAYSRGELDAVVSLNILKKQLADSGSHAVTDFADVGYTPNYTVLCVERTVYEQNPEAVKAMLAAHYEAHLGVEAAWDTEIIELLVESWNTFYMNEDTPYAPDRIVPDTDAFRAMLGDMGPEQSIDRELVSDCFEYNTTRNTWGWDGAVDVARLVDLEMYQNLIESASSQP